MKRNYKKKISKILLISIISILMVSLTGCAGKKYKITFKDYDDTVIKTIRVKEGELPEFGGTPTRESDSFYDYTFFSWDKPLLEAAKDETYTAVYVTDLKKEAIEEDINVNDDTKGENEKKVEEDKENPEKVDVLSNTGKTEDTYTVTFYDDDKKTVLQKSNYKYGSTPRYKNGLGPSKIVGDYLYVFKSWDKPITVVKSDQFYYAIYDKTKLESDAEERLQVESNQDSTKQESDDNKTEYTITVSAYKQGWGNVQGSGTYSKGASVTISATANEGYIFTKWSDGDSSSSRTISINANAEYTAIFEPKANTSAKQYYVNAISSDRNMGNVSIIPYKNDNIYNETDTISIFASPKPGYRFVKWVFGDAESNAIERKNLRVTDNITYIAFFEPIPTEPGGPEDEQGKQEQGEQEQGQQEQGQQEQQQEQDPTNPEQQQEQDPTNPEQQQEQDPTNPEQQHDPTNPEQQQDPSNPEQQQDPTNPEQQDPSNPGQQEQDPSNPSTDPSNPGTVDPNAKYSVKVSCNSEHGTVSGGSDEANGNSTLQLTATPNEGYVFVKWEDGNTDNPREVTVTGDHEYVAVFALDTFPVKGQIVTFSKEPKYHQTYIVVNKSGSKLLLLNRDSNITSNTGFGSLTDVYDTSTLSADCEGFYSDLSESLRNAIDNTSIDVSQYSSYVDAFDELAHASNAVYPGLKMDTIKRHAFALDISEIENYFGNSSLSASTFSSNDLCKLFNLSAGQNTWLRSQNSSSTEYMVTSNAPAKIVYYSKNTTATTVLRPAIVVDFNKVNKGDYSSSDGFLVDGQPKKCTLTITVNDSNKGSVIGEGQYPLGSCALIKATPTSGNKFVVWEDGSTNAERLVPIVGDTVCNAKFSIQGLPSKGDYISIESSENNGFSKYTVLSISGNVATLLNRDSSYKYPVVGDYVDYSSSTINTACTNFYNSLSDTLKNAILTSTINVYSYNNPTDDSNFNRSKHASYVNSYENTTKQSSIQTEVYLPDVRDIESFFGSTSSANGVYSYKDLKSIFGIGSNENVVLRSYVNNDSDKMLAIYGVSGDDIKAINSIEDSFLSNFCIKPIIKVDLSKDIVYSIDSKFEKAPIPSYTLTTSSNDVNMGTVTSGGTYEDGTKVELKATPKSDYRFAYWSDGNYDNPRILTVDGTKDLQAIFSTIDLQSGDVITLDTEQDGFKEYVVISINGSNALLMNRDWNLGKQPIMIYSSNGQYFDSSLDQYLNGEYMNKLSSTLKNAIKTTSLKYHGYYVDESQWHINQYVDFIYECWLTSNNYDRKIFILDESEIEKYFGGTDTEYGYYSPSDLKTLFNIKDNPVWLSSILGNNPADEIQRNYYDKFFIVDSNGRINYKSANDAPQYGAEARPSFVVDLSATGIQYTRQKVLFKSNSLVNKYSILVTTPHSEFGTVNGGGIFFNGTVHKISATPKQGYKFKRWNDGNTDNPRSITVNDNDKEYIAYFESDLHKGDLIKIPNEVEGCKEYLVLKAENNIVTLMNRDYNPGNIPYFSSESPSDSELEFTFERSELYPYYLVFYNRLSEDLRNVIVPQTVNIYQFDSKTSLAGHYSSFDYTYNALVSQVNDVNVYPPGIEDVEDYFYHVKFNHGYFGKEDINDFFCLKYHDEDSTSDSLTLRNAYANKFSVCQAKYNGGLGSGLKTMVKSTIRPMFVVDLSDLDFVINYVSGKYLIEGYDQTN